MGGEPDLVRALRTLSAELRGEPAAPGSAELRSRLLRAADSAVAAGVLDQRDRDVWVAAEGLGGRVHSRAEVGAAYGLEVRHVDRVRRTVTAALAATVDLHAPADADTPADDPSWERALARVQAELLLAGDRPGLEALREVRSQLLPGVTTPDPPRRRPANPRARRGVLARLRQELHVPVAADPRLLTTLAWPDLAAVPGAYERLRDRHVAPDPGWLATLVPDDRNAAIRDPAVAAALHVAVAGYARHAPSPDPVTEAAAWAGIARLWSWNREVSAVWAARRAATLVGSRHPHALQARTDAVVALRLNGYLQAGESMAREVLADLRGAALDRAERLRLHGLVLVARGGPTPNWPEGVDPVPALYVARDSQEELLTLRDLTGEPLEWHLTARRRRMMAVHQLAVHDALRAGRSRPVWDRAAHREVDRLDAEVAHAEPFTRLSWALTRARFSLDVGDRSAYGHFLQASVSEPPQHPVVRYLLPDLRRVVYAGRRRRWPVPDAVRAAL